LEDDCDRRRALGFALRFKNREPVRIVPAGKLVHVYGKILLRSAVMKTWVHSFGSQGVRHRRQQMNALSLDRLHAPVERSPRRNPTGNG
jgi:hypothetical protein